MFPVDRAPERMGETGAGIYSFCWFVCRLGVTDWIDLFVQLPIRESDIEEFLMGMSTQVAEKEDNIITPDLRGRL